MKKILISLFICFISLFSCNSNKIEYTVNNKPLWLDMIVNNYGNGRIFGEQPAKFIDYKSMRTSVICSKPNCTHSTTDCVGFIIGDTPIMTPNGIYFFTKNNGVKELGNGKREYYINSKLSRIDLKTSEIEEIVRFNDCSPHEFDGCVLFNDKIYFTADDLNPTEDGYGNIIATTVGGRHFLCCIDLKSKEYTNLGCIYDGKDYEKNSLAIIEGCYDSKLIISYQYIDSTNIKEVSVKMYEYNLISSEIKEISIPKPIKVTSDYILYYDKIINKTVIVSNDTKKELDIEIGTLASIFNNKLFIRDTGKWYDLSDLTEHNMKGYINYEVIDYVDESYILILHTKTIKLSEEELLALDKE